MVNRTILVFSYILLPYVYHCKFYPLIYYFSVGSMNINICKLID